MHIFRSNRSLTTIVAAAAVLVAAGCANQPAPPTPTSNATTTTPASTNSATTATTPATAPTGTPIVIGEYGSMTGSQSTFGHSTDNGIQMFVKSVNDAGGIDGHPLSVVLQDDEGKPDTASNVVKKLVDESKPTAILGEVASKESIQAAPVCNAAQVPMISPSSTNPKVTAIGPYVFRVCFIDPFQGLVAAKFAIQNLKLKTAAVMTDETNDYSTGLTKVFVDSFTKLGGKIVAQEDYAQGDSVYQSQLTKIKDAAPDILYVPGYYGDIGPIAKQARQIGLTVPLLGGDGWDSSKLIAGAGGPGGALEGCYFSDHYSFQSPDPTIQKFVAAYKVAYNDIPDALAALGYDAAGVLVDAIKRTAKPADGDYASPAYRAALRDQIAATKSYPGVTGAITLDANRNANKPAVILQVSGAGYKYEATINP